jgi:hypothetical protein
MSGEWTLSGTRRVFDHSGSSPSSTARLGLVGRYDEEARKTQGEREESCRSSRSASFPVSAAPSPTGHMVTPRRAA